MKIKISKLVNIKTSLEKLMNLDVPIKTAFKLGKIVKNFNNEYEVFEESKTKLFKKYGERNKEGNLEIKEENSKIFKKELEDLLSIEVNIKLTKVDLKELGDVKLSALDIDNLDILIKE